MEIVNRSGLSLWTSSGRDMEAREHLVVVAKATYRIDWDTGTHALEKESYPIELADRFVGEPGLSAPIYEADTALRKKRCDVVLDATAYSPDARPVSELTVSVAIGSWAKHLIVSGDRVWHKGPFGVTATKPQPFTSMPLHYGRAFGGPGSAENLVGTGHADDPDRAASAHLRLPNIEDPNDRVTAPHKRAKAAALGPIGRQWDPRRKYAGTYDARWRDEVAPLPPEDFEEAFYQCAPPDQQIDTPKGGEVVRLLNVVPGRKLVTFELPKADLAMKLLLSSQHTREVTPLVDTVFLEPDKAAVTLVYRATIPLDRRGIFGVSVVAAGPVCQKWWASRAFGSPDCGCNGNSDNDPKPEGDAGVVAPSGPDMQSPPGASS